MLDRRHVAKSASRRRPKGCAAARSTRQPTRRPPPRPGRPATECAASSRRCSSLPPDHRLAGLSALAKLGRRTPTTSSACLIRHQTRPRNGRALFGSDGCLPYKPFPSIYSVQRIFFNILPDRCDSPLTRREHSSTRHSGPSFNGGRWSVSSCLVSLDMIAEIVTLSLITTQNPRTDPP